MSDTASGPRRPDAAARRRLRATVTARHPWVTDPDVGPQTVEAGDCGRCGLEARLVATCGPQPWEALGRRCAAALGTAAWCAGHAPQAEELLRRLAALPADADRVARLWWVATGELRMADPPPPRPSALRGRPAPSEP